MAAVLLLVAMAALVIPVLGSARRKAERKQCLENLRKIHSGQAATTPLCPSDGKYTIPGVPGGPYPTCSYHGDLLQEEDGNRELEDAVKQQDATNVRR